jgi:tRNA(adenine34) deaminase
MANDINTQDLFYMRFALEEARKALTLNEVPVGAVAVADGQVVARGHNQNESLMDPTAHAEMIALREAALSLDRWRLSNVTLYVTLEPCVMCAGAMVHARLGRVVYGARDPKGGACGSEYHILQDYRLNHQVDVTGDVLREEASRLLHDFFYRKRAVHSQT